MRRGLEVTRYLGSACALALVAVAGCSSPAPKDQAAKPGAAQPAGAAPSQYDVMAQLRAWGLPVEGHGRRCNGIDAVIGFCREWADRLVLGGKQGKGTFWAQETGPDGVVREFGSRRKGHGNAG